jgi:hypothetical protein
MIGRLARFAAVCALAAGTPLAAQESLLVENVGPRNDVILVQDGTVAFAGPLADMPEIGGARLVDAGGAYALPGLIDMHVHVWGEAELAAYLAHGVTTIRNLSGMPFHLRMAKQVETGELAGPRLLTSGPILNSPGPNQQINHRMVITEDEGREAVREQAAAGYERVKVYSNLTAAAYRGVLDEARRLDMRVTGHSPEGERLEGVPAERPFRIPLDNILDDGFETLEHVETIAFHGLRDRMDEAGAKALVTRIAQARVPVTATLVAHRNLVNVARTRGEFAGRPGTEWLNPVTQATEAETIAFWSAQDPAYEGEKAQFYSWMTGEMHRAGVPIVAGSDAGIFANIPGASLWDELDLLVEAGLTPSEAVEAATNRAAAALGDERLGCMAQGCAADLVSTPAIRGWTSLASASPGQ